jgi:hypothetical protein
VLLSEQAKQKKLLSLFWSAFFKRVGRRGVGGVNTENGLGEKIASMAVAI